MSWKGRQFTPHNNQIQLLSNGTYLSSLRTKPEKMKKPKYIVRLASKWPHIPNDLSHKSISAVNFSFPVEQLNDSRASWVTFLNRHESSSLPSCSLPFVRQFVWSHRVNCIGWWYVWISQCMAEHSQISWEIDIPKHFQRLSWIET